MRAYHQVAVNPHRLWMRLALFLFPLITMAGTPGLGIFEDQNEIGSPAKAGSVVFDAANSSYVITGGGENMWFTNDSFHFVWKRVSGNFALQSTISWLENGGNAHRKACLIVRQTLEPDSPYVDVAIHGDGLTSLQFRERAGGTTHEVQASHRPQHVSLERQGEVFFLAAGSASGKTEPSGCFVRLPFTDPVYVGLGVCAHDNKALEKARFSNVVFESKSARSTAKPVLHCSLETLPIGSKDRRVVYHTTNHIEAPNWSRDGKFLLFNSGGRIFRLPLANGTPEPIDTGFAARCNNDHGLSPDGTLLAISDQSRGGSSLIYLLPASGGPPRQVTTLGPSYWHGWSPDGKTISYCGERGGEFDIYTIAVEGGSETRLTSAKGLDDGPDYSPDGKSIYFNSERSGRMQIWRMNVDGSHQEQVTNDEFNNWFPHPSPDGRWLVFLTYAGEVKGHPANQPVRLRLMPLSGGPIQDLASLFGGQGTINVPSWSPDSRAVAFVSYELITP